MATYVCSDIHGLSEKYFDLLRHIDLENQDRLIILGDVIDRGPDGFTILKDVLSRNNVQLLMGNHEYMMLEVLEANNGNIPDDYMILFNWILNGGIPTMEAYKKADQNDKDFVFRSLKELPFAYTDLVINERHFYLCHSAPGPAKEKAILYRNDIEDALHFVWDRMDPERSLLEGKTIVAGHTIVKNYHYDLTVYCDTGDLKTARYIDVDCGCAMNDETSRLACLCLDTMEVNYF